MDTTETYIKMRRRAISDLGMGIPIGDTAWSGMPSIWVDNKGDWYYSTEEEIFQLERQDQLQEMVFPDKSTSVRQMVEPFYEFVKSTNLICASMEQLWLAFVMKEKYNKVWDGEKWVSN